MRYIVGLAVAALLCFGAHMLFGLGSLPRPWGALSLGTIGGIGLIVVLYIWERISPSADPEERARETGASAQDDPRA